MRDVLLSLTVCAALACGRPGPGAGSSTDDTGTTTNASSDSSSDGSGADSSSEGSDEGGPVCGDGVVDPGEDCDLGPDNAWEQAACQPDCTFNECGDGYVGPDEACEPPQCSPDCQHLPVVCRNVQVHACGDWIDNDGDDLIDLYDPDCISPCDDNEGEIAADLPLGSDDCKFDCFFDSNTGVGDDKCEWHPQCDPLDPGAPIMCDYDPNLEMHCATLEQQHPDCFAGCLPITANGCDCFGCCEIDGVFRDLNFISCPADALDTCPPCTPHPTCFNPCEVDACELCMFGELAPGCDEPSCPEGVVSCSDPYACPAGQFCQTGCCRPINPRL